MKQVSLRIRDSSFITNSPGLSLVSHGNQRLASYEKDAVEPQDILDEDETPADSYNEFVDQFMAKLGLLMELRVPDKGNRFVFSTSKTPSNSTTDNNSVDFGNLTKNYQTILRKQRNAHATDFPDTPSKLMTVSLFKFLSLFVPASTSELRRSLEARSENLKTFSGALQDVVVFIHMIEEFPQAERLFIMGIVNGLTRNHGDGFMRDWLSGCEGADQESIHMYEAAFIKLIDCLKEECVRCIRCCHWRLLTSIVYSLSVIPSLQTPFLTIDCDYLDFFWSLTVSLQQWFETLLSESDVLISPGPFLDAACENIIPIGSTDAQMMLKALQSAGIGVISGKEGLRGITPISVLVMANVLRLGLQISVISLFKDYRNRCLSSSALRSDNLCFWTVSEVCSICDRMGDQYVQACYGVLSRYTHMIHTLIQSFIHRLSHWRSFAHVLYTSVNSSINPFCCVRNEIDEKDPQHASLSGDLLVSAGEALLTSHRSLFIFLSRTRLGGQMSHLLLQPPVCEVMCMSPRLQRILLVLLQEVLVKYHHVPELPGLKEELDMEMENLSTSSSDPKILLFLDYLLHLSSHADSCVGALVNEKSPCAICCPLRHAFFYLSETSLGMDALIQRYASPTSCRQLIRVQGHAASYCLCEIMEESIYLLRILGNDPYWRPYVNEVCERVIRLSSSMREQEQPSLAHPHLFHTVYSSAFIAVTRVFGGLIPRLYPGCRVRIAFNHTKPTSPSLTQLTHPASLGFVIQTDRMTDQPLLLIDHIDNPSRISLMNLEVVDRVDAPRADLIYEQLFSDIIKTLTSMKLSTELMTQPDRTMAFFNTSGIICGVRELSNVLGTICGIRCLQFLILGFPDLLKNISQSFVHKLISLAILPIATNRFLGLHALKQYFNWFIEYLINTFPGSPRFLPLTMQEGEGKEFGWEKEERRKGSEIEGRVSRDERRMRGAVTISGITGYDPETCYKVYRVGSMMRVIDE